MKRSEIFILAFGLAVGPLSLVSVPAQADDDAKTLYIYNWADYIGETTIADFTKETGIKVVYDTYDSSETVQAKMMAGHTGYDIIVHSASSYGPKNIKAGIFLKLDKAKIPNLKYLDPKVLKAYDAYDPGENYGVPYMWGTTGFTYNEDMIKARMPDAPTQSYAMVLDPAVVSRFQDCGVSFFDSPSDVVPMALSWLGLNPNSENPADYAKAKEALMKVRPYIRSFDNTQYLTALPNKSICLAMTWSGDYATATTNAAKAGLKINLAYTVPREGSALWFDAAFIPADAKHVDNALAFLNYIQTPQVAAKITDYTNYANANLEATKYVDKSIAENPAIYPDAEIMKRLYGDKPLPPKIERLRTRVFTEFKQGE